MFLQARGLHRLQPLHRRQAPHHHNLLEPSLPCVLKYATVLRLQALAAARKLFAGVRMDGAPGRVKRIYKVLDDQANSSLVEQSFRLFWYCGVVFFYFRYSLFMMRIFYISLINAGY